MPPVFAQTIQYTYDEIGRLKSVTNTANETAEYVYDAAGNITAIRRTSSGVPAVTEFSPNSGPVGTTVTIVGANFGATPAANTVRFNGTVASVSTASSTQLVATVPSGATTGPISVQTAAGTGTSAQNFTVTGSGALGVPTITSFSPGYGEQDSTITITGTNFNTAPGMTKVYLNQTMVQVTNMTATSITLTVPRFTGGGKLRVVTLAGSVTSSSDYVVIPSGSSYWPVAEYAGAQRLVLNSTTGSFNVSAPGANYRWVIFLFDGGPTPATVDFTTFNSAGSNFFWEIRNLRNEIMTDAIFEDPSSGTSLIQTNKRSVHIPPMMLSGTYALLVRISPSTTFNVTGKLRSDPNLPMDASTATTFSINPAANPTTQFVGQSLRYFIYGSQTMWTGVGLASLAMSPNTGATLGWDLRQQDWRVLTSSSCNNSTPGCGANVPQLPESAIYSLILKPPYGSNVTTTSGDLWLSRDMSIGPVTLNTDTDVPALRKGQNARITFDGSTGQRFGISISNDTIAPTNVATAVMTELRRSDSSLVASTGLNGPPGSTTIRSLEYPVLPATDRYTVFVDPADGAGGTVRVRVWTPASGTLAIDGSPANVALVQGQVARYTFSATTGQNLGLGVSGLSVAPSATAAGLRVLRPDGIDLTGAGCSPNDPGSGCQVDLPSMTTGAYTVIVTPGDNTTSTSFSLTLSTDLVVPLPNLGTSYPVSVTRSGRNARLTFSANAGQNRRLAIASLAITPSNQSLIVTLKRPSGSDITQVWVSGSGGTYDFANLPETGTYTLFVDQYYGLPFSFNATLTQY